MIEIYYNFKTSEQKVGKQCFVFRGAQVDKLARELGREDQKLCLKVFYDQDKEGNWGDDPKKGQVKKNTTLQEAGMIQNICAFHGLAPRVYEHIAVSWSGIDRFGREVKNKICEAQITEDLGKSHATQELAVKIYEKVIELGKEYGWAVNFHEVKGADVLQGKLIDFQTFNLTDDHKEKIKDKIYELGKWGKTHYQAIPELGIKTFRKTEQRIKELCLDKIDFRGKTVLDIGCSSGVFCNYASYRRAKRVVGVDFEKPVMASRLLSNFLGYWNNDYFVADLTSDKVAVPRYREMLGGSDILGWDIVFHLSILFHIGYRLIPAMLKNNYFKDGSLMILEWNNWHKKVGLGQEESEKKTEELLKRDFARVELVGRATDHGDKAIWHCFKNDDRNENHVGEVKSGS